MSYYLLRRPDPFKSPIRVATGSAAVLFIGMALFLFASSACHRAEPPNSPPAPAPPPQSPETTETPPPAPETPEPDAPDPNQWLVVTRTKQGTRGGHATGSFLPDRNRIVIETHDVERFTIDTSRIPINWDRLVVIRIDGVNSELRKRDYDVLHVARDPYGAWKVVEP